MTRGRKKGGIPVNKVVFTDEQITFIKDNFHSMTNLQLAKALGLRLTTVRTKCYELGLKKMEMEYWNEYHISFLQDNYKEIGDSEIADILQSVDPKKKGWSKKHVEKKRRYLGLKRSEQEKINIRIRNNEMGCYKDCAKKRWAKTGMAAEGEIRIWKHTYTPHAASFKVIKTDSGFVNYSRWLYNKHFGTIPKGMLIGFKDRDNLNVVPENLELIDRAEHARRNNRIKFYDPEFKELITAHKQLIYNLNKVKNEQRDAN